MSTHMPHSSSGGGSPDHQNYRGSAYRHMPGTQPPYGIYPMVPYPAPGFIPYDYYMYTQGGNGWSAPLYGHGHGYTTSPPSTPPQPQLPYGYPMIPLGPEYLPPSPPQPHAHQIPTLDHRRNSWSSSGATDTPTTPYSASVDPVPAILGDSGLESEVGKEVQAMLLSGPPLPPPMPAVYAPTITTLAAPLDNPTNTTNVYIRGLPPDTDDDKLYEMTCRFGPVISHKAIMDTEHGTCKGYGFARFETKLDAEHCIRGLMSLNYEAGFARESFNARLKTLADPNSTNIYVSNLPRSMSEKDMQDIFQGYVVVSNRILRDASGVSRGVGFARFESREICNEIIKKFHGMPVGEEALALQVRYADTSAQKRLKATTTKKRVQYRSEPGYYQQQGYSTPQYRNRVWMRHSNDQMPQSRRNWDRSQDWKGPGDENRGFGWRSSSNDTNLGLETVHEGEDDDDDAVSVAHSESNTLPVNLDFGILSRNKGSSHSSMSDPGDSYGGRECR